MRNLTALLFWCLCLFPSVAESGYTAIYYLDGTAFTLEVTFTDQDDTVSLRKDAQGYVTWVDNLSDPSAVGERIEALWLDIGQYVQVRESTINVAIVDLGDGDDVYGGGVSAFVPNEVFVIYGGDGSDNIKVATGVTTAYAFGESGSDTIKGEHNRTNLFWGGPGNDTLFGGGDGYNFLDGGSGNNQLFGFKQSIGPPLYPLNLPTVFVHNLGSNDDFKDFSGSGTYIIQETPGTSVGTLDIDESGSGTDVLILNGLATMDQNGVLTGPRISGTVDEPETIEVIVP